MIILIYNKIQVQLNHVTSASDNMLRADRISPTVKEMLLLLARS